MHGRTFPILSLLTLSALSACTDETGCPAGAKRLSSVCVTDDSIETRDAASPASDRVSDGNSGPDAGGTLCYLDQDVDGVGAGEPVDCEYMHEDAVVADDVGTNDAGLSADAGPPAELPAVVVLTGDCDDDDPARAPTLDELCDGIDNDCDEETDENVRNACGGECSRPLDHQPGEPCSNGLLGACTRNGTYTCQGDSAVTCSTSPVVPSMEICNDAVDNDCDGLVDEADAADALFWYQDCDGDGFAASTTGAQRACKKPANADKCSWTTVIPQPATKTNWDCNDALAAYSPMVTEYRLPPSGSSSWDFNCDGQTTSSPAPSKEELEVCSAAIIDRLNAGENDCVTITQVLDGTSHVECTVWKDSRGKYAASPTSKCPDAIPYKVTGRYVIANPALGIRGSSSCTVAATDPVWPCR